MSVSFILGNLLGRALVSYVFVWVLCWLASRFNLRRALRLSVRWYSVVAVVVLTLLGMAAVVSRGSSL